MSSISVSANALATQNGLAQRRKNLGLIVVGALALVLVPIAVLVVMRGRAAVIGSAGAAAAETSGPSATPGALPPLPLAVSAASDPGPPDSPNASPPTTATASAVGATTSKLPVRRGNMAAPKPANDCNPPFYYDPEGRKHWKANCI